jgi:hypothetical protein
MAKTIEQRVGDAVLQTPKEITVSGRTFTVAPPSTATLLLVSEGISLLPQVQLDNTKVIEEVLYIAKDCRVLGEIVATLILGSKGIIDTVSVKEKRFFGLFIRTVKKTIDRRAGLAKWLLEELAPAELHNLFIDLIKDFQLGDFFGLTTFLIEINLLRPTKVVTNETTASGQ